MRINRTDIPKIRDERHLNESMRFILQRLASTPSMASKLPKYLLMLIDACVDYMRRNGR